MTDHRLLALALDAFPGGAVVMDVNGVPVHVNARAREVVDAARMLTDVPLADLLNQGGHGRAYVHPLQDGATQVGWAVFTLPARLLGASLEDVERLLILETFEACERRVAETARRLGISRVTLWRRLRTYAALTESSPRRRPIREPGR